MGCQQSNNTLQPSNRNQNRFRDITKFNRQVQNPLQQQQQLKIVTQDKMKEYPHNLIGLIIATDINNKTYRSSAVLITPWLIITVAHTIFDVKSGRQYRSFVFYPSPHQHQDGIVIKDWRYRQQYPQCAEHIKKYDYALMKLSQEVKRQKYISPTIISPCFFCISQRCFKIYGYPFKEKKYNQDRKIGKIYQYGIQSTKQVESLNKDKKFIFYWGPIFDGQSGCPLISQDNFIGIHVSQIEDNNIHVQRAKDRKLNIKRGILFAKQSINNLQSWASQMSQDPFRVIQHRCDHQLIGKSEEINESYEYKQDINIINLHRYPKIENIYLSGNRFKEVDFSKNKYLVVLELADNLLKRIDLSKNFYLKHLNLKKNNLLKIELKQNKYLQTLQLGKNNLKKINVSQNDQLKILTAGYNQLSAINLSEQKVLVTLQLNNNEIQEIKLKNNIKLVTLFLNNNKIKTLKLQYNRQLELLNLQFNLLKQLDISQNTKLKGVSLRNNIQLIVDFTWNHLLQTILVSINLSEIKANLYQLKQKQTSSNAPQTRQSKEKKIEENNLLMKYIQQLFFFKDKSNCGYQKFRVNPSFKIIYAQNNRIRQLQAQKNSKLIEVNLRNNFISNINLEYWPQLKKLQLSNNLLTQIVLDHNVRLTQLKIETNKLCQLNVSKNKNLITLDAWSNQLTSIDVSENTSLQNLWLQANFLKQITVSTNTQLRKLWLQNNRLKKLDVTKNIWLIYLQVWNNQLEAIDVTSNTQLKQLWLHNNRIQIIDLTRNANLTHVELWNNKLKQIDITQNIKLEVLRIWNNKIAKIDLKANKQLTQLWIQNNRLMQIDVSQNTQLIHLRASNNRIGQIDITKNTKLVYLRLDQNLLQDIDLRNNHKIQELGLQENSFTTINLENNKELVLLLLCNNDLKQVNLQHNSWIRQIDLQNNPIEQTFLSINNQLQIISLNEGKMPRFVICYNPKMMDFCLWKQQIPVSSNIRPHNSSIQCLCHDLNGLTVFTNKQNENQQSDQNIIVQFIQNDNCDFQSFRGDITINYRQYHLESHQTKVKSIGCNNQNMKLIKLIMIAFFKRALKFIQTFETSNNKKIRLFNNLFTLKFQNLSETNFSTRLVDNNNKVIIRLQV